MSSINLIPLAVRQAQARREHLIRWTVAGLVSAALAAIPYSVTLARQTQAAEARRQLEALEDEASTIRSQLRLETARTEEALSELERSKALRAKRSWSAMVALIAASLPQDAWLLSVATDPEAPSAAPPRPTAEAPKPLAGTAPKRVPETVVIEAPQKMRLVGNAGSDTAPLILVGRLMESKVFSHVALEKTTRAPAPSGNTEEVVYQFEIVCEW